MLFTFNMFDVKNVKIDYKLPLKTMQLSHLICFLVMFHIFTKMTTDYLRSIPKSTYFRGIPEQRAKLHARIKY